MKVRLIFILIVTMLFLAACTNDETNKEVDQAHSNKEAETDEMMYLTSEEAMQAIISAVDSENMSAVVDIFEDKAKKESKKVMEEMGEETVYTKMTEILNPLKGTVIEEYEKEEQENGNVRYTYTVVFDYGEETIYFEFIEDIGWKLADQGTTISMEFEG